MHVPENMNFFEFKVNLILGVMRLFSRLPLGFHYFCGDTVAWFMKNILHYRQNVVITNIARSFPEMSYQQVRNTASAFYRHLGEIFAETIWFCGADYRKLKASRICEITNLEVLAKAYETSPSVTVLYSHCGNWEILGGFWCYNYVPDAVYPSDESCIKVVYKRLHNPVWDEVFKRNRSYPIRGFEGEIESGQILRYAIRHREQKCIYIFPTDQYPYAGAHDAGLFLNQPTKVMLGGAALAHKLGMSVLYLRMKHLSRGKYQMTLVPVCGNAAETSPEEIMAKYLELLQEDIREQPHNWLWSHKRWKHL